MIRTGHDAWRLAWPVGMAGLALTALTAGTGPRDPAPEIPADAGPSVVALSTGVMAGARAVRLLDDGVEHAPPAPESPGDSRIPGDPILTGGGLPAMPVNAPSSIGMAGRPPVPRSGSDRESRWGMDAGEEASAEAGWGWLADDVRAMSTDGSDGRRGAWTWPDDGRPDWDGWRQTRQVTGDEDSGFRFRQRREERF